MNTGAPVGGYYLNHAATGTNSFYQGTYATFTPAQPTYFSFWMRTNTTTAANGYVVIGNSNIGSDNGILFCYFNATSGLRFFNTTGYNHPITANTWYHVEARNVNWSTRVMDIYVNNALILSSWAFRSTTAMDVDRVHLFSLSASSPDYDDVQIGIPGVQINGFLTSDPLCFGDSTGAVDISASTVNGSMTYAWSNGAVSEDLTAVPSGSYVVTVTDSIGCTAIGTYNVVGPAAIAATSVTTDPICPGGNSGMVDLSVTGGTPGYTYLWSNGATTEDISAVMAGTYTVAITDSNGCTSSDSVTLGEPAAFQSSSVVTSPTCQGGSDGSIDYTISGGTPGYTYLWTTGDSTQDISGITAGTQVVLVSDSLGCIFQDSIQVTEPAPIVGNEVIVQPTCNGFGNGSISLAPSGGTPIYTYQWSTGGGAASINASAGTYTVTITDANGCTTVATIVVAEPAAISLSSTITADNGTGNGAIDLTVAGGTPGFTYAWSNGATTEDITGLAGGTYTVTVTDQNGCTSTSTFNVDIVIGVVDAFGLEMTAWPNPFGKQFTVSLTGLGTAPAEIVLVDLAGRVLWQLTVTQDGPIVVGEDLALGAYFLQLHHQGQSKTLKMLRQ
jgi:hypothetical protein